MDKQEDRKVFNFTEQPSIIQELDRIAAEEGTSRPALIRRAIRMLLNELRDSNAMKQLEKQLETV